jgi:hypothetical protein
MSISSKFLQLAIAAIVEVEANLHLHKSSETKFLHKRMRIFQVQLIAGAMAK